MAKSKQTKNAQTEVSRDLGETGEYNLPIEPKSGRSAGSGAPTRRMMILLSLALGMGAALLVWWLGSNL